ncbi:MAG TPA: SAM-dependent methyltransferase, partial [Thermoanaerobaculia bacterium]|nr:SAM-dependent methyltransferase [Thermoanaerobaculia bacterium]
DSKKTLVLSEGLLVYLTPEQVGALAIDLHAADSFRWWAIDIVAPQLLARLNKQWAPTLAAGRAVLQFAPEDGTDFFEPYGWREIEYRSTFEEGIRLRRHMRGAWFYRLIGKLSGSKGREKMRRIGGIALLERT